ncbi:uncharacterized protein LOC129733098 [Wyeomyia smithii]|uniref:uncharacterized protein LOC129733098 n=1 Tax=Wyeomyia smithii TaxID=174621 RepID=UPI0024681CCE|nr:uncharacterized protein LOC129733098 [Wyeomyia smithii]
MLPVAGNIQTARKNCFSQNYPFRKEPDEADECYELPPSEYDDNYIYRQCEKKPNLRREWLREQFRKKATETIMKQMEEQYATLHRQEVERMPLRKRADYYMERAADNEEPQYNLYKADDMTTYWSYQARSNATRRKNSSFTKPISEQLDQQFG